MIYETQGFKNDKPTAYSS